MVRSGRQRERVFTFVRRSGGRSDRRETLGFKRPARPLSTRFRDLISGKRPVVDTRFRVLACYTPHQETCVTTLRSRSLKQTERNLYRARPVSDSLGRCPGNGVGR